MPGNPLSDELLGELPEIAKRVRVFIQDAMDTFRQEPGALGNLMAARDDIDRVIDAFNPRGGRLVTELRERRKAGTFAEGIEAAAKVADIHADGYAEAIRGLTRNKFATEYRGKHDAARKIGRAIRSLTPNKDTTS